MIIDAEELPTGVTHYRRNGDILVWSNQKIPIHKETIPMYIFIILVLVSMTLYFVYQIINGNFSLLTPSGKVGVLFFLAILIAMDIGFVIGLRSREELEMIKITDDAIVVRRSGFRFKKSTTKIFYKKGLNRGVIALSFLRYGSRISHKSQRQHDNDGESHPSLNIMYSDSTWGSSGENRETLALWMRTEEKYQLFLILQSILQKRGWIINFNVGSIPTYLTNTR